MAKKENFSSSTGLNSNVAAALSYVLGIFTGVLFLVVEKNDKFVRFHAMQSIFYNVAVYAVYIVLLLIPIIGWLLLPFWLLISFVIWLLLIYKAYLGKRFELPIIGKISSDQVK